MRPAGFSLVFSEPGVATPMDIAGPAQGGNGPRRIRTP